MSPTYWTASQFKMAARANGWEFIPCVDGKGPWGARKGRYTVMIRETRTGGLSGVWFTYPVSGGSNCDYLGPRYRGKLAEVLAFLNDPTIRHPGSDHRAGTRLFSYVNDAKHWARVQAFGDYPVTEVK